MSPAASHPSGGTKNPRFMAFIVFAAIFMAVLDGNVVNIALPTITTYFGVDVTYSQWVVTAYLVTLTSLLLIFGRVSEYVGRGRMFILGFVVFTLGSLACGLAPDLPILILFRVVQATVQQCCSLSRVRSFTSCIPGENRENQWGMSAPPSQSAASRDRY